ncbi:MAG: transcriptional repressor [Candidatus Thermoplasmatota archaeon]|nr:transcriptional repressor [Candidatus Thermoplasmatota archaeon]
MDVSRDLKAMGLKMTPQRIEIIRILNERRLDHPSLNELHSLVKERMPSVSFSTLYNTISTLEKHGYLNLIDLGGETRIEMKPDSHINIIDRRDGRIQDIDDEDLVRTVIERLGEERVRGRKVMVNVILY